MTRARRGTSDCGRAQSPHGSAHDAHVLLAQNADAEHDEPPDPKPVLRIVQATKWRCPTGECASKSMWRKADRLHPLIPRDSKRFRDLYRSRSAVEREFGSLKHEWSLLPLRVRGLDRVRLHADLTILAKLACALTKARAESLRLAA